MPRQSRSSRPSAPAPRAAPAPQQSRPATTAAAPAGYNHPHAPAAPAAAAATSSGPGMMAQMAATAGSVAVGSTIGHGLSSMLFGGSSARNPEPAEVPLAQQAQTSQFSSTAPASCAVQAKDFTSCLEKADLPSCTWYLEQLKACQAAAAPY